MSINCRCGFPSSNGAKVIDMRTIKELAKEAIAAQDACNLSAVVHSFSRAMTDLREIAHAEGWESTDKINGHPISILYADKIASLTISMSGFSYAYAWCKDTAG